MAEKKYVVGFFKKDTDAISVIKILREKSWPLLNVQSPVPNRKIIKALGLKKSKIGFATACGCITGFIFGLWLVSFTSQLWNLNLGGSPTPDMSHFLITAISFCIFFGTMTNLIFLIISTLLPSEHPLTIYDSRSTGDCFTITSSCSKNDQEGLIMMFIENQGDVKDFERKD